MRKLIDIPDEILEDLQIKAVKAKKFLKNYIEDLLVMEVIGRNNTPYVEDNVFKQCLTCQNPEACKGEGVCYDKT